MSVIAEAISVVVRRDVLAAKYPGGFAAYQRDCPNRTFCFDDNITRVGFMAPTDVESFVRRLTSVGFVHLRDGRSVDICVVDQNRGPTAPCDWLDGGKHPDGYSAVWLKGTVPGTMFAPSGWRPSQSRGLTFVPTEEAPERLLGLANEDGLETHLDFKSGKQVFIGRSEAPPLPARPTPAEPRQIPPPIQPPSTPSSGGLGNLKQQLREQLLQSYRHKLAEGVACSMCGATGVPLAFNVIEKSIDVGEPTPKGFVPMSSSRGRVRGSFPVCITCAPPCKRCGLPRLSDRLMEFAHATGAPLGSGACEHIQWGALLLGLFRRAFGTGRFARSQSRNAAG